MKNIIFDQRCAKCGMNNYFKHYAVKTKQSG